MARGVCYNALVFAGGSYDEVARWLQNFVASHAKRESPRLEAEVEISGARAESSYGVRLRLGDRHLPHLDQPQVELTYPEVRAGKGSLPWCQALAGRVRGWARELLDAESRRSVESA